MPKAHDLTGRVFGRLTAVALAASGRRRKWRCRCECGNEPSYRTDQLLDGAVKSCGCYRIAKTQEQGRANRRHGHAADRTGTYTTWRSMHDRCKSTDPRKRIYYLDRGITVCERWQSFDNFLADMGLRPEGMTLDREDNERGYEPGNCKWATHVEQRHNQRRCLPDSGSALSQDEEDYINDTF